jgi:hypothetical protein
MGKMGKQIITWLAVIVIATLPMSVVAAGIDCIFHDVAHDHDSHQHIGEPVAQDVVAHDSFDLSFDVNLELKQDGVFAALDKAHNDNGNDNGCQTGLFLSVYVNDEVPALGIWSSSFEKPEVGYRLTKVLLPTEIRPPISA